MFTRVITVFLIIGLVSVVIGFPDGAPADTCVRKRPNEPNHGKSRSQTLESLPYQLVAKSQVYHPGSSIEVSISGNDVFRGFFIQARDSTNNNWIGTWTQSPNTKGIPECSAITHADNKDKQGAVLIWQAPQDQPSGYVYFT